MIDRSVWDDSGSRRGAALAIVFFFTLVMSILVAAVYILFTGNVKTYEYTRDRTGARYTAEAGARLAVHELSLDTSMPEGADPFFMPHDSSGWIAIPGVQGRALVVIDPRNNVSNPFAIRGVQIRSRGRYLQGQTDIKVTYAPDAPSRYALLVDRAIPAGFFKDGRRIDGPVHCNGVIDFSSVSADSIGDPYVDQVSSTSEGGFRFSDVGMSLKPHPDGSSVWVQPYGRHLSGTPNWDPLADEIDFQRIEEHFRDIHSVAQDMGTVVIGVKRIILDGNTMLMKADNLGPVTSLELGEGRNLVYIVNGAMPVYIKSGQPSSIPLTIVTTGNVYISGGIRGGPAGGTGPVAIVSLGDIVIASDPDHTGGSDWSPPWNIQTEGNLSVQAYLAAPSGELRSESLMYPGDLVYFTVIGGLMQESMGRTGTAMSGRRLEIQYDEGLNSIMPPYFPILENWIMTSWLEDPDYGGMSIEDDQY
ncbi:MAG: hypothetical protein JXA64_08055 [Candidatus Fermentibacteraceae bacterium]|nr:hypothetical protein [Candidatus Fermentibacteraceae bacterium]MBN2609052.1 hypothetical protein [Candidatus Fermentibacteraceae bacterium]